MLFGYGAIATEHIEEGLERLRATSTLDKRIRAPPSVDYRRSQADRRVAADRARRHSRPQIGLVGRSGLVLDRVEFRD